MIELLEKIKEDSDAHSVYKNLDPALVEQIKAIETPETFNYRHHINLKVIQDLSGKEVLCQDPDGNSVVIPKEEIEELKQKTKIYLINKKFDVCQYFNRFHSEGIPSKQGEFVRKIRRLGENQEGRLDNIHYLSERYSSYDGCDRFEFETTIGYGCCFIEFNEEGNIESRDYNVDFIEDEDYKFKSAKEVFTEYIKEIESIPHNEFVTDGKGNYFVPEVICYDISDRVEKNLDDEGEDLFYFDYNLSVGKNPYKSGNRYGLTGCEVITLKKKGNTEVTKSELIEKLWDKFNKNIAPITMS
jgi:hypothetical protein